MFNDSYDFILPDFPRTSPQIIFYNKRTKKIETIQFLNDGAQSARIVLSTDNKRDDLRIEPKDIVLPAYDYVLKCSHTFNLLDARGVISKDERINYINRVRRMAAQVAKLYVAQREEMGFPLCHK